MPCVKDDIILPYLNEIPIGTANIIYEFLYTFISGSLNTAASFVQ